ncbi:hypothetical protein RFI_21901 [Reticulomyxa filosa]|uniref:Guanylate cyclase domain-containing protein n=1 Tax=Reticulomyxa filosa TaxID=46433 RepID=X6MNP9_RETFI|nr:hypothetical protein RFI_21901 [Reticulomyxa filosa]|eukprot:ETO15464.1 hypothetical protein RFI_21901 [Reticulomyxa filosa]
MILVGIYIGDIFQLTDTLLIHSLLFLSYLWYQFKYLKYRNIAMVIIANILYFIKICFNEDEEDTWKEILYSCLVFNCGILSMIKSFYFTTKQQLRTMADDLSNHAQLRVERKEHTRIMNSLMPAPVTEQILLKGDVPIYRRDVTIGFVYFTFYNKITMEKIKDNSPFVKVLHHLVINFDKEIEQWEFDVVKIEHVGNAYLICGGIMSSDTSFNHAEASYKLYFNSLTYIEKKFRRIVDKVNAKLHVQSELTMGIHTGPVIGTIIGTTRKFFRIFGDTVNTASRVCTTGLEGCIQATQQTYESFDWLVRGDVPMKGKGNICTYIVRGLNEKNENTSLSTSSWIKRHIRHKMTDNANLLEMNFHQFLNSEDTHANPFTLRFPAKMHNQTDNNIFVKLSQLFVSSKLKSSVSLNDNSNHGRFSNNQIKEFNLEEIYQVKLLTTNLCNYSRLQIALWTFNLLLLLNSITIRKHMPHDNSVYNNSSNMVTLPPMPHISSYMVILLSLETIVAFLILLQTYVSHILSHGRQERKLYYRRMIAVYILFWLHVLNVNYVSARTHRFFGRFIANIFYIMSFRVFPFRFFELAISSIILAFFVDGLEPKGF